MKRSTSPGRRVLHSLAGSFLLLALLVVAVGLDWPAMMWADPMSAPPKPAPSVIYWHKVP